MEKPKTTPVLFPPTPAALVASNLLEEAIGYTLRGYSSTTLPWKYEADFEARTLMWLVIRNAEGVYELARKDLILLPAALSATRSAFEIAIRALWLLDPKDPFDREVRWLAQLQTEESFSERYADKAEGMGLNGLQHRENAKNVRNFRLAVAAKLPLGYSCIKQLPKLDEMLKNLDQPQLYTHYMTLSQFAHGTHYAGRLFRQNLGCGKNGGEFVYARDWQYPLEICFRAVTDVGSKLADVMGGSMQPFVTDAFRQKFRVALSELRNDESEANYWKR
jgi:hypothetical protein